MGKKSSGRFSMTITLSLALCFSFSPSESALSSTGLPSESLCAGSNAIVGTVKDDVLTGTDGDDLICGLGGNDQIQGLGGNDIIIGGLGIDTLFGGSGNDRIRGGQGDDTIKGGAGDDRTWGEDGIDIVAGDDGLDYVSGGSGADHLYGGLGIDTIFAGTGDDGIDGGPSADSINGEAGDDTCVKDTADRRASCSFDERGPRLVNISIQPGTEILNASSTEVVKRILKLRFTVADPGAGMKETLLTFQVLGGKSDRDSDLLRVNYQFSSCESMRQTIESSSPIRGYSNIAGYCLLSGNSNLGVYEAMALLPQNAKQGTWALANFYAIDEIGNRTSLWDEDLAKQKMRIKFKQIGITDTTAPSLNSIELSGPNALKSKSDKTFVSLSFKDNKSLLSAIHLGFLGDGDASIGQTYNLSDFTEIPKCDQAYQHFACLLSGDLVEGSLKLQVSYNAYPELP